MKTIGKYLLCASLIAAIGCVSDSNQRRQDNSRKNVATKPELDDDEAATTPASEKILPAEQLNPTNANEQADAMRASLIKERGDSNRPAADKE